jgi:hypothetical protein
LCRVDDQLSRLADAVRARGFRVEEKPVDRSEVTLAV